MVKDAAWHKAYYERNRPNIQDRKKQRYNENREDALAKQSEWRCQNKKHAREYDRQYRQKHKAQLARYRREYRRQKKQNATKQTGLQEECRIVVAASTAEPTPTCAESAESDDACTEDPCTL
jgi:hypothetical protein